MGRITNDQYLLTYGFFFHESLYFSRGIIPVQLEAPETGEAFFDKHSVILFSYREASSL